MESETEGDYDCSGDFNEEEFPIGCPLWGLKREGSIFKSTNFDICPLSSDGRCERTYRSEAPNWYLCGLKSDRNYNSLIEFFENTMVELETNTPEGKLERIQRTSFNNWWKNNLQKWNKAMKEGYFSEMFEDDDDEEDDFGDDWKTPA